jgi:hypothetical protein
MEQETPQPHGGGGSQEETCSYEQQQQESVAVKGPVVQTEMGCGCESQQSSPEQGQQGPASPQQGNQGGQAHPQGSPNPPNMQADGQPHMQDPGQGQQGASFHQPGNQYGQAPPHGTPFPPHMQTGGQPHMQNSGQPFMQAPPHSQGSCGHSSQAFFGPGVQHPFSPGAMPFMQHSSGGFQGNATGGPGHVKHDQHQYGQLAGLIGEFANGNPDMTRVVAYMDGLGTQFWKGAMIGAAATLIATNDQIKAKLSNALGSFLQTETKTEE